MAADTKIEWADHTFNPWIGCTKVSPGCDHCYAKAEWDDRRHRAVWGPGQARSRTKTWGDPVKWSKQHEVFYAKHGRRQRVFCASLADVFDNEVPTEWRHNLFNLIKDTPELDWLLLTKRPQNIVRMVQDHGCVAGNGTPYLPGNVWLGTSVEDQHRADINVPALIRARELTGADKTFLSMEPLLGPVDLRYLQPGDPPTEINALAGTHGVLRPHRGTCDRIDWVIIGGESGPGARPMHPDWARSLRDQCQAAGVPFLFKQWGNWSPPHDGIEVIASTNDHQFEDGTWMERIGKKQDAGRQLDGRTWDEVPA